MSVKPIRFMPEAIPARWDEPINCGDCGADVVNDMQSGFMFEDIDKGDYIQRTKTKTLCGRCMKGTS